MSGSVEARPSVGGTQSCSDLHHPQPDFQTQPAHNSYHEHITGQALELQIVTHT